MLIIAFTHILYFFNSSILIPILLAYSINFPFAKLWPIPREYNLDIESEKVFRRDERFLQPLYAFVLLDTLSWVWCLCVVSEVNPLADTPYEVLF